MRNSHSYIRLLLKTVGFQIVISLLGMMLGTATGAYSALRLIGAACAVLCYFYIVGSQFWTKGSEDAVGSKNELPPVGGFLCAVLSFAPSIICMVICSLVPMMDAAGNPTWSFALFAAAKLVFMGAYFGFAQLLYPTSVANSQVEIVSASQNQSVFLTYCTLPAVVVCMLCYYLGFKGINPFGMFGEDSDRSK